MMVATKNAKPNDLDVVDLAIQRGPKVLLEDVSFSVTAGDLIWITGTNGSGKTSLLKCLAGLLRPNKGNIISHGDQSSIAYLGHNDGHKTNLTVRENLEFWHSIYGQTPDLEEILKRVGIWDIRDLLAKNLSAGQSRRVALARLLLKDATLWLLDEPAAPMDAKGRDLIAGLIKSHLLSGGSALIATHSTPLKIGVNAQVLNLGGHEDG
jgi:heme exporter protein A